MSKKSLGAFKRLLTYRAMFEKSKRTDSQIMYIDFDANLDYFFRNTFFGYMSAQKNPNFNMTLEDYYWVRYRKWTRETLDHLIKIKNENRKRKKYKRKFSYRTKLRLLLSIRKSYQVIKIVNAGEINPANIRVYKSE